MKVNSGPNWISVDLDLPENEMWDARPRTATRAAVVAGRWDLPVIFWRNGIPIARYRPIKNGWKRCRDVF